MKRINFDLLAEIAMILSAIFALLFGLSLMILAEHTAAGFRIGYENTFFIVSLVGMFGGAALTAIFGELAENF